MRKLHFVVDYTPPLPVRGVSWFDEWAADVNGRGFKVEVLDGRLRLDADTVQMLWHDLDPLDNGCVTGEHNGELEIWFGAVGHALIPEDGTGTLDDQILGLAAKLREGGTEGAQDRYRAALAAAAFLRETPNNPGADLHESLETMLESARTLHQLLRSRQWRVADESVRP